MAARAQNTNGLTHHVAVAAIAVLAIVAGGIFAAMSSVQVEPQATTGLKGATPLGPAATLAMLRNAGIGTMLALLATLFTHALSIARPLMRRTSQLAADVAELTLLATTDPLTGALNKRSFQDRGAIEIQKAKRYNRPLSLLMIDADHFDALLAGHGQGAGDIILKALTAKMFDGTRVTDLVGRVGTEGFAILLPETEPAGARLLAERLRTQISELAVPIKNNVVSCTVSIGVAAAEKDAAFFWPTFKRADDALVEAKMRGRNRVFVNAA